jgi:hypothetical protein
MNDPTLRDLPYKIELNNYGKIEMRPASNRRGRMQILTGAELMRQLPDGIVIIEAAIPPILAFGCLMWRGARQRSGRRMVSRRLIPPHPKFALKSCRPPTPMKRCARRSAPILQQEHAKYGWCRKTAAFAISMKTVSTLALSFPSQSRCPRRLAEKLRILAGAIAIPIQYKGRGHRCGWRFSA